MAQQLMQRSESFFRQMSKLETPMTEAFWQAHAKGAFVAEYPLVRRSKAKQCSTRLCDAAIFPGEAHGRASVQDYPSLSGRDVILVQTKCSRMGMYLMGQALFSARLALASGAKSVRSVLLCCYSDAALLPLLAPFPEVEVWTCHLTTLFCLRH